MAQGNQDELITWLKSSNLTFLKDALVEEDYTLDMIVDMTDEDMNDIIDGLNMPKLKRPRFRNAVKRLKQNSQSQHQQPQKQVKSPKSEKKRKDLILSTSPNAKTTTLKQGKEETFESLLSTDDSQRIKNAHVIISAIEDYSQSKPIGAWCNLYGTTVDFQNMIHLWNDIYM